MVVLLRRGCGLASEDGREITFCDRVFEVVLSLKGGWAVVRVVVEVAMSIKVVVEGGWKLFDGWSGTMDVSVNPACVTIP
jgi:hypothetical protein